MYEDTVRRLQEAASESRFKVKETIENQEKLTKLNTQVKLLESSVEMCQYLLRELKPLIADIQTYINEKSENGLLSINRALALAGEVIPDSMRGVSFAQEGDKAWLEVNGIDVDKIEGSGFKGTSSMFLQATLLRQNPDILQTIIFDEMLSKVSTGNSAEVSACLPFICQDLQVILIEQKKEVFANNKAASFLFFKDEDSTRVELESEG